MRRVYPKYEGMKDAMSPTPTLSPYPHSPQTTDHCYCQLSGNYWMNVFIQQFCHHALSTVTLHNRYVYMTGVDCIVSIYNNGTYRAWRAMDAVRPAIVVEQLWRRRGQIVLRLTPRRMAQKSTWKISLSNIIFDNLFANKNRFWILFIPRVKTF